MRPLRTNCFIIIRMKTNYQISAAVILVSKNNEFLLQQRDNKPGITNPGQISCFGGAIEPGEEPAACALREIKEETSLSLKPSDIKLFNVYKATMEEQGWLGEGHFFVATGIDANKISVHEGRGLAKIPIGSNLDEYKLTIMTKRILLDFVNSKR